MVLIIKSYHLKSNRIKGKITMIKIQHIEDIKKIRNIEKTVKGSNRSIVRTLSSLYFCATIVSTTKQSV